MSPGARGAYRMGHSRREIAQAVLGVLAVVLVTAALIWVFAPDDPSEPTTPPFTLPPELASTTTIPGGATTTLPPAPPTTTPG